MEFRKGKCIGATSKKRTEADEENKKKQQGIRKSLSLSDRFALIADFALSFSVGHLRLNNVGYNNIRRKKPDVRFATSWPHYRSNERHPRRTRRMEK